MKKLISLILTVCMVLALAAGACAESADPRPVLQDGMAPQLVGKADGEGNIVYATVYDANGNEVSKITDASLIGRTDISERASASASASERLNSAFMGMMFDVHFSDVKSKWHDDLLKIDINNALVNSGISAYDLVMFENFDLELLGDAAAALAAEGNTVEMTFALLNGQPAPSMIVSTQDGQAWEVAKNFTVNPDNTVTVCMEDAGIVSFLVGREATRTITTSREEVTSRIPYTKEVTYIDSPTGEERTKTISGVNVTATVVTSTEEVPVSNADLLVVTPLSERDYIVDIQTHEQLEWAYDEVLNAADIGTLTSATDAAGIGAEINAVLADMGTNLTHSNLYVSELFEVSIYGDYLDYLYAEDNTIHVTFPIDMAQDSTLVVLVSSDGASWQVLPAENVVIAEDGSVTLRLHELGAVAFAVPGGVAAEAADMSPAAE